MGSGSRYGGRSVVKPVGGRLDLGMYQTMANIFTLSGENTMTIPGFFQPFNKARIFYEDTKSKELLASGPAGTGKSRVALEKMYRYARRYPRSRHLIVRKTRASLVDSALQTLEEHVLGPDHPLVIDGPRRDYRKRYPLDNGSEIIVGGMDKATRIMSTEFDMIFVQEAIELTLDEWEALTTRLRNGKMPFQQLIADTNPTQPRHWLYLRTGGAEGGGTTHRIDTEFQDNPIMWDHEEGIWTPFGREYIATLDNLTGARKRRLRYGEWVQAEGVIFDGYNPEVHDLTMGQLIQRKVFRSPGVLYKNYVRRAVFTRDFGYTNPGVLGLWIQTEDDRWYMIHEVYMSEKLDDWWIEKMVEIRDKYHLFIEAVVCDPAEPGTIKKISTAGWNAIPAYNRVRPTIDAMKSLLQPDKTGTPRMFFYRDALEETDPVMLAKKLPTRTTEEIPDYIWADNDKEEPVKKNDHGCLVAGTAVATRAGDKPIESVRPGDEVLTRDGYRKVLDSGMTQEKARVFRVDFSDGRYLIGTGDHPVFLSDGRCIALRELRYNEVLQLTNTKKQEHARGLVLTVCEDERADVFNLTVEGKHEFFANGVLVHNCDQSRYLSGYAEGYGDGGNEAGTW